MQFEIVKIDKRYRTYINTVKKIWLSSSLDFTQNLIYSD